MGWERAGDAIGAWGNGLMQGHGLAADLWGVSARILVAAAVVTAALVGPTPVLWADTRAAPRPATVVVPLTGLLPSAALAAASGTAPLSASGTAPLSASGAAAGGNKYVPVTPSRILDSRSGVGWWGKVEANTDLLLPVAGVGAVPSNATAVVFNLTVTEPEAKGFVTVWPADQGLPNASSANIEYAGQTIANLVTVPLGGGAVRIFNQPRTHLLADVAGYYVPAAAATDGRFVAMAPTRLLDTRSVNPDQQGPMGSGGWVALDVAGATGLSRATSAVVLNLTVDQPGAAGYVSIIPPGSAPGEVSSLNVDRAGQVVANQVIVPLVNGRVSIYSAIPTHVIVDINGSFTGTDAPSSGDGLFVPVTPGRLLDTRDPANSPLSGAKPPANHTVDVVAAARRSIPATGFAALVLNATATEASGAGFFTLWGAGLGQPLASNLNANFVGQTVPNHVVVPVSTAGFSFFTSSGASLIVDVAGYFTGTAPPPQNGYSPTSSGGPPTTGPHTFLYQLGGGTYARWNPCAAIPYRVNYSGAPSFARDEVDRAVAKLETATGIDLVNLGDTTVGNNGTPPADAKAVISFVSPSEYPNISGVAGLGGGSYYPPWNGQDPYVASGFVLINETLSYSSGTSSSGLEGLLLHEIGHMIGLDHVATTAEVMYGTMHNLPSAGYGPGDREGLWNLGVAKGCLNSGASSYASQAGGPGAPGPANGPDLVTVLRTKTASAPPTSSAAEVPVGVAQPSVSFCDLSGSIPATAPSS